MSFGKEVNAVYRNMDVVRTELHFPLSLLFFFPYNLYSLGSQASVQPKEYYFRCVNRQV